MDEFNNAPENTTNDKHEEIKRKLRQYYDGRIVRKDLTKSIREGANVPVYVLEYLLGQYCNSDDEEIIEVRKLFQYWKYYSGKEPEFIEGDVFRIIVPLDEEYSYDFSADNRSENETKSADKVPIKCR